MALTTTAKFAGFADKQPAYLRSVIVSEDQAGFDQQYREALRIAADELRVDALESFLEYWRRIAWSQHHMGHDRWRAMLDKAERIMAGERFPTVSMEEMDRRIAERLAAGR